MLSRLLLSESRFCVGRKRLLLIIVESLLYEETEASTISERIAWYILVYVHHF